jgi:hypothetical protein
VLLLSLHKDSDILGLFNIEDFEERHRMVKKGRVWQPDQWFLKSNAYANWVCKESMAPSVLICFGIGNVILEMY